MDDAPSNAGTKHLKHAHKSEHDYNHHDGYDESEDTPHLIIPFQTLSEHTQSVINVHA